MKPKLVKYTSSISFYTGDIFPQYKIVKTTKTHPCLMCNNPIKAGCKIIMRFGVDDNGNNHQERMHTDDENQCYLDFVEMLSDNESDERQFILEAAGYLNRK